MERILNFHQAGWLALALICSAFVNLIFLYYLCFKKLEVLEKFLEHSTWASDSRNMFGGGIIGRNFRLNAIAAMIFLPNRCHKRGLVDKADIKRIPKKLRRFVAMVYIGLTVNSLAAVILAYFIEN